jgi:hypothetical protein
LGDLTEITGKSSYRDVKVNKFARRRKMEIIGRVYSKPDTFEQRIGGAMSECLWINLENEDGNSVSVVAYKQMLADKVWNRLRKLHESRKNRVKMLCTFDTSQPNHPHSISVQEVEFL